MPYKPHADNQGLLAYEISSLPDPIQASSVGGDLSLTSIVITVSNNSDEIVYCNQITFTFPDGDTASDLTSSWSGVGASVEPSGKWQIAQTSDDGVFIATPMIPPDDNLITTDGLSFIFKNIYPNQQVGAFTLNVDEYSSTDNVTFTDLFNEYDLAKFPYGFFVNDFKASALEVNNNENVTLTWVGSSNATYTMFWGTQSKDVSTVETWTTPEGLTETTTFSLQATATVLDQTVDAYFYVTVVVAGPDLVARTLTVLETSVLTGSVGIGTATPANKLSVAGNADISGTLSAADALRADGRSFLYANGLNDGTSNVVLRKDEDKAYLFPWGTGTTSNTVLVGGGHDTSFVVTGDTDLWGALNVGANVGIGTDQPAATYIETADGPFKPDPAGTILTIYSENDEAVLNLVSNQTSAGGHLGGVYFTRASGQPDAHKQVAAIQARQHGGDYALAGADLCFFTKPFDTGAADPNMTINADGTIWAKNNIVALAFNVSSDARIKDIQGRSDGAADLQTLLGIEVTDYRHKDAIGADKAPHKKLVAQQVEKIFPQAVGKYTGVVPDIYRQASCAGGWVDLETDLKKGERVRLISGNSGGVYEVLEATQDTFRVDFTADGGEVFVFGREVDDFRTIDYDAVAMLNVSATQQLKKENDEEISSLRAEIAEMKAALQSMESKMGASANGAAARS
jgi:hypothetical protein